MIYPLSAEDQVIWLTWVWNTFFRCGDILAADLAHWGADSLGIRGARICYLCNIITDVEPGSDRGQGFGTWDAWCDCQVWSWVEANEAPVLTTQYNRATVGLVHQVHKSLPLLSWWVPRVISSMMLFGGPPWLKCLKYVEPNFRVQ